MEALLKSLDENYKQQAALNRAIGDLNINLSKSYRNLSEAKQVYDDAISDFDMDCIDQAEMNEMNPSRGVFHYWPGKNESERSLARERHIKGDANFKQLADTVQRVEIGILDSKQIISDRQSELKAVLAECASLEKQFEVAIVNEKRDLAKYEFEMQVELINMQRPVIQVNPKPVVLPHEQVEKQKLNQKSLYMED